MVKIYAPKGFRLSNSFEKFGNVPKGKTTILISLKKGNLKIPFLKKKVILSGKNWKPYGGGMDSKGEYISFIKK